MEDLIHRTLGIPIYESEFCFDSKQYRFPRSKRKRIRNKWCKDKHNWRDEPRAYECNDRGRRFFIAHPSIVAVLKRELIAVPPPRLLFEDVTTTHDKTTQYRVRYQPFFQVEMSIR